MRFPKLFQRQNCPSPPPYESNFSEKISYNEKQMVLTKAAEWKKRLQSHEYPEFDIVVGFIIENIDERVAKHGVIPTGFMISDTDINVWEKSIWTTHFKELQSQPIQNGNYYFLIHLQEDVFEKAVNFLNSCKLNREYLQRFIKYLIEKTGLKVENVKCINAMRTNLSDKSEFNVSYLQFDIKLPDEDAFERST